MKLFASLAVLGILVTSASAQDTTAPAQKHLPTLWLIGDSTVKNGTKGLTGWGDPIRNLFDPTKITVENRARGGRSSRTYLTEGLWDAVLKQVQPGDFVLMQFGHNDGGKIDGPYPNGRASLKGSGEETQEITRADGKTETVHTYGWYIRRYVEDAKAKGATPIVLSMIPRNDWKDGKVLRADNGYGLWAKQAAEAEGVTFINLNGIIADKYDAMGPEKVAPFFPQEHTHTNADGAQLNAQCVAEGLRALPNSPLAADLKPVG
jgi:lysophospholipase L1-like esterase